MRGRREREREEFLHLLEDTIHSTRSTSSPDLKQKDQSHIDNCYKKLKWNAMRKAAQKPQPREQESSEEESGSEQGDEEVYVVESIKASRFDTLAGHWR